MADNPNINSGPGDHPLSFAPTAGSDAAFLPAHLWMGTQPVDLSRLASAGSADHALPAMPVPESLAGLEPVSPPAEAPLLIPVGEGASDDASLSLADRADSGQQQAMDERWKTLLSDSSIDRSGSDKTDGSGNELWERSADDVRNIQMRIGHKAGDAPANYSIDKDGKIHELIPPDKKAMGDNDDTVVIEFDDSAGEAVRSGNAQMRETALRLIADIHASAQNAGVSPDVPPELTQMLEGQPVPAPQAVPRGGGRAVPGESNGGPMGPPGGHPGRGHSPRAHNAPRGDMQGSVPAAPSHFDRTVLNSPDVQKAIQSIVHDPKMLQPIQNIMAQVVSKNEGRPSSVNWNDNGAGVSVGMFQWNQRRGELPELMNRMAAEKPEAFKAAFGQYAERMTNEAFVRSASISPNNALGAAMQTAMNDPELQKVQYEMAAEKVATSATVAKQYGLTSEAGVAVFTDMVNQLGMGSERSSKGALPDLVRAASSGGGDEAITHRLLQFSAQHAHRGNRTRQLAGEIRGLNHAPGSMWNSPELALVVPGAEG